MREDGFSGMLGCVLFCEVFRGEKLECLRGLRGLGVMFGLFVKLVLWALVAKLFCNCP